MKLSIDLIFNNLKKRFPKAVISERNRADCEMVLDYPRYISGSVELKENGIYIVRRTLLPESPHCSGRCLIITPDEISGSKLKNISVITVRDAHIDELFNAVLSIYDRYIQWDSNLQQLIFDNATLDKYLECSLPVIGHPMSVHNENFSYIARAGSLSISDDNIHNRNYFDPDFLLRVDQQCSESIFFSRELICYSDEATHIKYMFLNLFSGNTFAGRLAVLSEVRPFEPYVAPLVMHLSRYLQAALSFDSFSGMGKNLRRDSLIDYLSGKPHNDATILHLKTISPFSHLADDQMLYCLVCNRQSLNVSEQYVCYQLERALPESVSVLFDDRIVVVCMNRPGQSEMDFYDHIMSLLRKNDLNAGISNAFRDFFDLKYCYQEAVFALRQIDTLPNQTQLVLFKDVTLEHFLQYGFSIIPIRLICADCVIKLAEHDMDSSVSYCDSLEAYLGAGCNLAETARMLNVTRNTFLSRLERIMRFIDLDIHNSDDRLYIQISLRLIKKTAPYGIAEKQ